MRTIVFRIGLLAFAAAVFLCRSATASISEGLLAHYPFDGSAIDATTNHFDGALMNAPTFVSGVSGQAVRLVSRGSGAGATGDYVLIPSHDFAALQQFTLSLWVYEEGLSGELGQSYINFGSGWLDRISVDRTIRADMNGVTFTSIAEEEHRVDLDVAVRNAWKHYAYVFSNGVLCAYVDGQMVGATNAECSVESSDFGGLGIHWGVGGSPAYTRFTGAIDDVRIYGRALSSVEVATLWNETQGPCDLTIDSISAPSFGGAGVSMSVTDTTRNLSSSRAGSSVTRFYLSANTSWDAGDRVIGSRDVPVLPPGAASTATTSVVLPADASFGTWYLIAKADADGTLSEASESNNTRYRSMKVGADLYASALSAPYSSGAGRKVIITDSTRNVTTGSPASPSVTRFYLSVNSTWSSDDILLGARDVPTLVAGEVSSGTTEVEIPAGASTRVWYIIAKVDATGAVPETNESNNTRYWSITIGPDLVVSSVSTVSASGAGRTISISDTTRNAGAGEALPSTTKYYLSVNSSWSADDVLIGTRAVPQLGPGLSSTMSTPVVIPEGTAAKTWYILAKADGEGAVAEINESNNVQYRTIKIGPDLTVVTLTAPTGVQPGVTVTVKDTVRNTGGGDAAVSVLRIYLSANTALDAGDSELGHRTVAALAPGAASSGSTPIVVPQEAMPGKWYLIVKADADNAIAELAESNNIKAQGITVGPDLTVYSLSASPSNSIPAGSVVSVRNTVKNSGSVVAAASVLRLFWSADGALDGSDQEVGSRAIPSLGVGASSAGVTTFSVPHNANGGTYWIIAKADADAIVPEVSESNNTKCAILSVLRSLTLTDGLLAHYEFNGDAKDSTTNHFDGTLVHAPTFVPGVKGQAVHLVSRGSGPGATGDHVLIPSHDFASMPEYALSLWVYEVSLAGELGQCYINFCSGWFDRIAVERTIRSDIDGVTFMSLSEHESRLDSAVDVRNHWRHYVYVFSNSTLTAFVDGAMVGATNAGPAIGIKDLGGLAIHWGAGGTPAYTRFTGMMDDVRIYGRSLSAAEVEELYAQTFAGTLHLSTDGSPAAWGSPTPAGYGDMIVSRGTVVTNAVASPVNDGAGIRRVCLGWGGSGSVPESGASNYVIVTMQTNSTLTWRWGTHYYLDTAVIGSGTVDTPDGWHSSGDALMILATPSNGCRFVGWSGDFAPGNETNNPLAVVMDRPKALTARFETIGIELPSEYWNVQISWGGTGAGDGQLNSPTGIAEGPDGLIYVADTANNRIQVFDQDGVFVRKWGTLGSGDGQLKSPVGLAFATNGLLYITDQGNNRVQVFSRDGSYIRKWGVSGTGDGQFKNPRGVTFADGGALFIADTYNHRIQVFTAEGAFLRKWNSGDGTLGYPHDIARGPDGLLYVTDTNNDRIQVFQPNGTFVRKWGANGTADGRFVRPCGVAFSPRGLAHVTDYYNDRVQVFTKDGEFVGKWGHTGVGSGEFKSPWGMTVASNGRIYVVEFIGNRIQVFKGQPPL